MSLHDPLAGVHAAPARHDLSGGPPPPMPSFDRPRPGAEVLDEAAAVEGTAGPRSRGPDLRLAVERGWWICATGGLGEVVVDGGILRYDPELPQAERSAQVHALLRDLGDGPRARPRPAPPAPAPSPLDFLALVADAPDHMLTGADLRRSARTLGFDAAIWAELRPHYQSRPKAARRLWRAILDAKALPDDVVGPVADALADFPENWTTSHAWAALTAEARGHDNHGIQGFARAGFDAPADAISPAESVVVWLVFMAYADQEIDLDDEAAQAAFAAVVLEVVGLLADAARPASLLAVYANLRSAS